VDATSVRLTGRRVNVDRASDDDGQVVDASCSPRRNAAAAQAICKRALAGTGSTLERDTIDKAAWYLPVRRVTLPVAPTYVLAQTWVSLST
jgi:transposase-like protein